MNSGCLNAALKKGLSASAISNRQISSAYEQTRKRRDELIQKKRGRIETASLNDQRSTNAIIADPSRLNEYAAIVLSEDPTNMVEAARQIRRLLSQKDGLYVDDVIRTGIVAAFIKFLSYNDQPRLQFESVWALTNIASGSSDHTAVVVNNGAIEPLLSLLQSKQLEVQEQSVWALGNISGDCDQYRELILQHDGFSVIVSFAQHNLDKIGVVKNCIWCLSNLCRNQRRDSNLFRYIEPFLPFLQQLLQCTMNEVVADACWAFCFLTDTKTDQKKTVIQFINANYLMRLILTDNIHIQSPALRLAGNIVSGDKEDTQFMLNAGLLRVLAMLLDKVQDIQKKEVIWILSNITAGTPQQIRMVIDIGFVKYLVNCANNDNVLLQTEAIWAICNAINGGSVEQIRYIVEKQVVGPLVRILSLASNRDLIKNILVSINRILKVGHHVQKHCQLDENPYYEQLSDIGGVDKVWEIQTSGIADFREICEHIMRYCDLANENAEEMLPNI